MDVERTLRNALRSREPEALSRSAFSIGWPRPARDHRSEMHTDANEIAGLLEEIFCRDLTGMDRICQHCHRRNPIGAHTLFHGAGLVLRCPTCGHPASTIVPLRDGHAVSLHGTWLFS